MVSRIPVRNPDSRLSRSGSHARSARPGRSEFQIRANKPMSHTLRWVIHQASRTERAPAVGVRQCCAAKSRDPSRDSRVRKFGYPSHAMAIGHIPKAKIRAPLSIPLGSAGPSDSAEIRPDGSPPLSGGRPGPAHRIDGVPPLSSHWTPVMQVREQRGCVLFGIPHCLRSELIQRS
jgi:hypothetical protein